MRITLASRHHQSELMDDPLLNQDVHRHALKSLGRINWLSQSDNSVWTAIRQTAKSVKQDRPLTILDIAAGGGDLAIRIASLAEHDGVSVAIDGCDISPTALKFATDQATAAKRNNVRFFQCDALIQPFPLPEYDIVMCSLFLHHLKEEDAMLLLQRMKAAATKLVLVNDLRRTTFGYWLAWLGCRILTRCHVVHVDGPMSVEGAFASDEAKAIAAEAGLADAVVTHHWPQRFLLKWCPADGDTHVSS